MRRAGRLLKLLTAVESAIAAVAYVTVALLLIGDVVGREFFNKGIFGATKMAVFAAIIAGFIGLSLATAANAHLRPAFLDGLFRGRASDRVNRVGDGFACAVMCVMGYFAVMLVMQSFEYREKAAVLYWQLWPIQLVIPYAFFSSALRHAAFAVWPALKPVAAESAG